MLPVMLCAPQRISQTIRTARKQVAIGRDLYVGYRKLPERYVHPLSRGHTGILGTDMVAPCCLDARSRAAIVEAWDSRRCNRIRLFPLPCDVGGPDRENPEETAAIKRSFSPTVIFAGDSRQTRWALSRDNPPGSSYPPTPTTLPARYSCATGSGRESKASITTRRTCFCVLSTCKNVGKRRASVRGEYRLRTKSYGFGSTQTRRRTLSACRTFLRAVCGFTTRTCDYGRRACPVRTVRKKHARGTIFRTTNQSPSNGDDVIADGDIAAVPPGNTILVGKQRAVVGPKAVCDRQHVESSSGDTPALTYRLDLRVEESPQSQAFTDGWCPPHVLPANKLNTPESSRSRVLHHSDTDYFRDIWFRFNFPQRLDRKAISRRSTSTGDASGKRAGKANAHTGTPSSENYGTPQLVASTAAASYTVFCSPLSHLSWRRKVNTGATGNLRMQGSNPGLPNGACTQGGQDKAPLYKNWWKRRKKDDDRP
ncbi:hypothetical protein Bbelb_268600 [Branchiostoma belcheri]|nr:hypothetical protein Bbelb_268600 [Branchiostoma belcheri]